MNSRIRGYIIHSGVVALLFSLVVIATGSALKFRSESPNPPSAAPGRAANILNAATTLTFGQRIAYQRAIEHVYWRHRIWPKENGSPKPALDAVISQAAIEQKVTDYIHKSQALEDYWQRALTTEQLQAEMDRMAQQTKQPDVLRELFEALGNDPFVIAECLARPTLAERLLPHSIVEQSEQTSQTDSQIVVGTGNYTLPTISDLPGGCIEDTWTPTSTTDAPTARFFHRAVWTGSEVIIWGGQDQSANIFNTGGKYNPSTDSWTATSTTNAPTARLQHTAVWTGIEMIVWGGFDQTEEAVNTGGRYDPSADSWIPTSTSKAPSARDFHRAVWSGSEMIIWGGQDSNAVALDTGGRFDPATNSWTATSTSNAPTGRYLHTAVWTGSEMIIWGGFNFPNTFNTGGRYNPGTNSWTPTSTINAPSVRAQHQAVWTGSAMIVWGGSDNSGDLNTGGRYCAQGAPTPTPTPCTGRCSPTPRPRPTPAPRP